MNTKSLAIRVIGTVVAGFLAVTVTAGPADAAGKVSKGGGVSVARDSGWGPT